MDGMPQLPNTVRFFVDPASIDAGSTTDADLIHQWQRVLRLRIGADVLLLDGAGMQVHVVLTELTAKLARWEQRATAPAGGEPTQHVTLCAALIRPERYEWLLQKSVELGVSRIVPLLCERSRVDAPVTANKDRANKEGTSNFFITDSKSDERTQPLSRERAKLLTAPPQRP